MRLFNVLPRSIASLTVGENKFARALLADSVAAGSGALLFGLDLARNEGPWQWSENLHRSNAVLRYSQFASAGGFSVTGMTYRSRWDATDQIPQRAVYGGLVDHFGTLDGSDGVQTHRYSVSFEGEKNTDAGRSAIQLYAIRSELNLFSNFTYQLDNPADLGSPIDGDQFEQAEFAGDLAAGARFGAAVRWRCRRYRTESCFKTLRQRVGQPLHGQRLAADRCRSVAVPCPLQ
jgi:hypothetical protein